MVRIPEEEAPLLGFLQNLSVGGIGFRVGQAFLSGTRLSLLLINAAHTYSLAVEVEVIRCSASGVWGFYVGGRFCQPIQHEDLIPLLV
jgi:hypothetical protein